MNPVIRRMLHGHQGMGDYTWGDFNPVLVGGAPSPIFRSPSAPVDTPSSNGKFSDIVGLISKGLDTFTATKVVNAQQTAMQLAATQQQQRAQNNQDNGSNPPGTIGFGFDSKGLRFSDGGHLGWGTMMIAGAALFLLQSPGFTRKR